MNDPVISVVLPVYNGEKYLKEAIGSILDQSFADYELIIINDGSTDETESIIHDYKDHRIRYVRQENTGIGLALNNGCRLARGKYIARMDADDISFPERFKIQKAFLDTHPNTVVVSSAVIYIDSSGAQTGRSFPYTADFAIRRKLRSMNPVCHPGVMMRTSAYRNSIGYLNLQPFEDHMLWLSMSTLGKLHNFCFPLLYYRILDESASRTISMSQSGQLFMWLREKLSSGGLDEQVVLQYNERYRSAKRIAGQLSEEKVRGTTQQGSKFTTSAKQLMLYNTLKRIGFPERRIERLICMVKNNMLSFL